MHPLARSGNKTGFDLGEPIHGGDRVLHRSGKRGVMDEALHDGGALVSFDDGTFGEVKWRTLTKEPDDDRK